MSKQEHWSSPNGCHQDCPACEEEREETERDDPKPARLTMEQRGKLARDVFAAVFDEFESFTEHDIGKDLAYLLGAILDDTEKEDEHVDWTMEVMGRKPNVLSILERAFTERSAVWKFIIMDKEGA